MTPTPDSPPDRLAINPRSKFFDQKALERGIGIRFKGRERFDVEEYCLSGGWIRVQAGKARDRHGNPLTVKLTGPVEAWFQDAEPEGISSEEGASSGSPSEVDVSKSDA